MSNTLFTEFRSWTGLTQAECAEACGVTRSTVARWEAAVDPVPVPDWLADALELGRIPRRPKGEVERLGREAGDAVRAALYARERARKAGAKRSPPHPRLVLLAAAVAPRELPLTVRYQRLLTDAMCDKVWRGP